MPDNEQIQAARRSALWNAFVEWGSDNGVEAYGEPDDWYPHWECFAAGAAAQYEYESSHPANDRDGGI